MNSILNSDAEEVALSYGQRRLWLLDQIDGGTSAYNIPAALRLEGPLNTAALTQSLAAVIERHEPLRTIIMTGEDDQPLAYVIPTPDVSSLLPITDLQNLSAEQQHQELQTLLAAEAATPFNLAQDLPLRAHLYILGQQTYVLALTLHHHASDGLSVAVFTKDLSLAYQAYCQGQQPSWTPLSINYADWAAWQQTVFESTDAQGRTILSNKIDRAKQRLANAPELLTLPLDYPRDAKRARRSALIPVYLPKALTTALEHLAQAHQTTIFTILLAAYGATLSRLSNQSKVVIGAPVAGRNHLETEELVGFFVNTLVLPVTLSTTLTSAALIEQTKATLQAALADQDLPFERLVEELGIHRSLDHTPVFQAMLTYIDDLSQLKSLDLGDLTFKIEPTPPQQAKIDLHLYFERDSQGALVGQFEYDADLFTAQSVSTWAHAFTELLTQLPLKPESAVISLPLLTPIEYQAVVQAGVGPALELPSTQTTLVTLFAQQAALHPQAIAIRQIGRAHV